MNYPTQTTVAAGQGISYATTDYAHIQECAVEQPRFDSLANRFSNIPDQLHKAIARCRMIADRYGGAVPEAVSKEQSMPPQNCVAGQLQASADSIELLVSKLHEQIGRLERF